MVVVTFMIVVMIINTNMYQHYQYHLLSSLDTNIQRIL